MPQFWHFSNSSNPCTLLRFFLGSSSLSLFPTCHLLRTKKIPPLFDDDDDPGGAREGGGGGGPPLPSPNGHQPTEQPSNLSEPSRPGNHQLRPPPPIFSPPPLLSRWLRKRFLILLYFLEWGESDASLDPRNWSLLADTQSDRRTGSPRKTRAARSPCRKEGISAEKRPPKKSAQRKKTGLSFSC